MTNNILKHANTQNKAPWCDRRWERSGESPETELGTFSVRAPWLTSLLFTHTHTHTPEMEINFFAHQPLWLVDLNIYQPLIFFTSHFLYAIYFLIYAYILNNIIVTIDKKRVSYCLKRLLA